MVKYVSTYTKGTLKKRSANDLSNGVFAMFLFFSDFLYKAYVVGTNLNRIEFKSVPTTCAFIKK